MSRTSIAEYEARVCQPGGSWPQLFFQLDLPSEDRYPLLLLLGCAKGVSRLRATNVVCPCVRRGVWLSSTDRRPSGRFGELFRRLSFSLSSYTEAGREDVNECTDDAEFERRCEGAWTCLTTRVDEPEPPLR